MNGKLNKQVVDLQSSSGITSAESNEFQRNWNDEKWNKSQKEGNYDRTRSKLNFEIAYGGIVQEIDKSRTVGERIALRLKSLGLNNPNDGRKNKNIRICGKFIIGGSRERMHQLAFGNHAVNLKKGADNSSIVRCKDIEDWAKDVYNFVSNRWGEDNIVGFYVHLDEMNPHIHCCVLPITEQNKISYKMVFGGSSKNEFREKMLDLHSSLSVINKKYGLERGSSIIETGTRHRSTEEYRRELDNECTILQQVISTNKSTLDSLQKDIHKARIKKKSLSTMIGNLEKKHEELSNKKNELLSQINNDSESMCELKEQLKNLNDELNLIEEKIIDKKEKLKTAEDVLSQLQASIDKKRIEGKALSRENAKAVENIQEQINYRLSYSILPEIYDEFREILSKLNVSNAEFFNGTILKNLTENGDKIMKCALLLFAGYLDQAISFAQSSGGSGGSSTGKWGRDDDEEDKEWARRCMLMAHQLMKPVTKIKKKR